MTSWVKKPCHRSELFGMYSFFRFLLFCCDARAMRKDHSGILVDLIVILCVFLGDRIGLARCQVVVFFVFDALWSVGTTVGSRPPVSTSYVRGQWNRARPVPHSSNCNFAAADRTFECHAGEHWLWVS